MKMSRETKKTSARNIADNNYNAVYENLVKDENDLVGKLAYCIYKERKREFIVDHEQKNNGRTPSRNQIHTWVTSSAKPHLEMYKKEAVELVNDFVQLAVDKHRNEIELNVRRETRQLWPSVWHNILANFFWTIIIAFIIPIVLWAAKKDLSTLIQDLLVKH